MRNGLFLLLVAIALLVTPGCGRKPTTRVSVTELEKAFASSNADPVVSSALAAVRTNGYAAGVMALQVAEQQPGMTPDQLIAVQHAMRALTADLVNRAAAGDAQAQADLAAIEKTRSQ